MDLKNEIKKRGRGSIFFLSDFTGAGSAVSIRKALSRLVSNGVLIRLSRGIYLYPQIDTKYGLGYLLPSTTEIASAFALNRGISIIPTGQEAMNVVGLSEQVQMKTRFLTNWRSSTIDIGSPDKIELIHSSDSKLFQFTSFKMQLLVLALKQRGDRDFEEWEYGKIKTFLNNISEKEIKDNLKLAPLWIQSIIKKTIF